MNKGFVHYFRQAFKCAVSTIWKSKGRGVISSFVYFFISLFGYASIVLSPMISLADVRMGKIAKNEKVIDIPQSFSKASQKPLWTYIVAILLEILIYLGGFLLLSVVAGAIFGIGMLISSKVGASTVLYIAFAAPGLIIYSIYTIIMLIMFAPTAYVVDTNPNVPAGEVIAICFSSLKSHGKTTTFLLNFVPMAIQLCIAGLFAGIMALTALVVDAKIMVPVLVIVGCVSLAGMMLSIPIFSMTRSIAQNQLFGDIALDPVNASKRTSGINIRKISGAKIDREEVADNLSALFDEAVVERTAEPEELQRKHKNKNIRPVNKNAKPQPQPQTRASAMVTEEPAAPPEEEFEDLDYPEEKDEPRYESFESMEEKQSQTENANAQQQQAREAAQLAAQRAAQEAAQRAAQQAAQEAAQRAAQQAAQREAEQAAQQQAQQQEQQQAQPAANPYAQQQAQQQPQPAANPYAQQQAQQTANPYAQQGQPQSNPYAQQQAQHTANPYAQQGQQTANPYAQQQGQQTANPYAQQQAQRPNPYAQQGQPQSNPYAQQQAHQTANPYAQQGQQAANPYAQQQAQRPNPYAQQGNPYANPYAQQGQQQPNPYAQQQAQRPNPYAQQGNPYANPYAQQGQPQSNPYAQQGQPRPNPYAQPNPNPAQGGNGTNGNGGTNV